MYDGPAPIPTGDRMVWLVPSDRNPKVRYRVDATANNGAMQCSCPDFRTRRQPNLDAGMKPIVPGSTICKHCEKVVFHFVRDLFPAMSQSEQTPPDGR